MSVTPSFHPFPRLPSEIRREIYLRATPSRFVHVQEWVEDYEDFEERFKENTFQVKLHPSLTHFAHNWRHCLRSWRERPSEFDRLIVPTRRQSTLEAYGFTSSKPAAQPWPVTKETPELPLPWLLGQPGLAWCFTRESYLYSKAPIPPFLHVCSESRETLIRYGYQLAFGTRTHGPRTWFHFRDDVLHLERSQSEEEAETLLLCQSDWNVGQFLPEDLLRVRRLSLSGLHTRPTERVSNLLRLFGHVAVLYVAEWLLDELVEEAEAQEWRHAQVRAGRNPWRFMELWDLERKKTPRKRDFWRWIDCDDVDAMQGSLPWEKRLLQGAFRAHEPYLAGEDGELFWEHKFRHWGERNTFFPAQCREIADRLLLVAGEEAEQAWNISAPARWETPIVMAVHLGTASAIQHLLDTRKAWSVIMEEMKQMEQERGFPVWTKTSREEQ